MTSPPPVCVLTPVISHVVIRPAPAEAERTWLRGT